jgi:hypothetical protein
MTTLIPVLPLPSILANRHRVSPAASIGQMIVWVDVLRLSQDVRRQVCVDELGRLAEVFAESAHKKLPSTGFQSLEDELAHDRRAADPALACHLADVLKSLLWQPQRGARFFSCGWPPDASLVACFCHGI